jgi:hypothetical protein
VAELRERGEPLPHDLRYADLEAAHLRAYRDYVVKPWPGRLTLFRAANQHVDMGDDPYLGWQGMVGEVDVLDIPGTHSGIVEKPELPPSLSKAIQAARSRTRPAAANGAGDVEKPAHASGMAGAVQAGGRAVEQHA